MADFKVFVKLTPSTGTPQVTFRADGMIMLSVAALRALSDPEHVELLFDQDERLVAFRATKERTPNSYNARRPIPGRAFSAHYGISVEATTRYAAVNTPDGLLVVDIKVNGHNVSRVSAQPLEKASRS